MTKKLKDIPFKYRFVFPIEGYDELNIKVVNLRSYDDFQKTLDSYEFELTCIKKIIDYNYINFKNCIWFYSSDAAPPSKVRTHKGLFYKDNNYQSFPSIQKEIEVAENRTRIYALVKLMPEYINGQQIKLLNWHYGFILFTDDAISSIEKQAELWNRKGKYSFSVDYSYIAKYLTNNPKSVAMRYFPGHNYKDEKMVFLSQNSLTDFKTDI